MKDKLKELLMEARDRYSYFTEVADHLIANGVTVNEWRPASEPPKENGEYLVIETNGKHRWQRVCKFATNLKKIDKFDLTLDEHAGWYGYSSEYGYYEIDDITHWMPLPTPPKEV